MKDISELLRRRVKCIGNGEYHYPGSVSKVGDILYEAVQESNKGYYYSKDGYVSVIFEPENYPHLFKPLAWYEDREESQLPEYVKNIADGHIFKVCRFQIALGSVIIYHPPKKSGWQETGIHNLKDSHPATLEEYNQYISQGDINKK